jgi:hypothetical protein
MKLPRLWGRAGRPAGEAVPTAGPEPVVIPAGTPRLLIVSSCPGDEIPQELRLEAGGLPAKLALRGMLQNLRDQTAARGAPTPLDIDTLHLPYQASDYRADLLEPIDFPLRYDAVLCHIVLNSGARVSAAFHQSLKDRALAPHGCLLNAVGCIRKSTLHALAPRPAWSGDLPCVVKLDRNFNRPETVHVCRSASDLAAWRQAHADGEAYVCEDFHQDYLLAGTGLYRLERWISVFEDLTVEQRVSDDAFVKSSTCLRYQLRDLRGLERDRQMLNGLGWDWPGQSIDCAYDDDGAAWDIRRRILEGYRERLGLHLAELDVVRTGRTAFEVIDVNNTSGVLIPSRHCLRLAQAHLLEGIRGIAAQGR